MIIDNYAAKIYNSFTLYHWHCICPVCNNTTRYLSLNMNIQNFPKCDRCNVNKIINPIENNECGCLLSIEDCFKIKK